MFLQKSRLAILLSLLILGLGLYLYTLPERIIIKYLKPEMDRTEPIPYENHLGLKAWFIFSILLFAYVLVFTEQQQTDLVSKLFIILLCAYRIIALMLLNQSQIDPQDPERKFVLVMAKAQVFIATLLAGLFGLLFLMTLFFLAEE